MATASMPAHSERAARRQARCRGDCTRNQRFLHDDLLDGPLATQAR
jgi:hypothetical protein